MHLGGNRVLRHSAACVFFLTLVVRSHGAWAGPAGFVVSMDGEWTAEKVGGRRVRVGETLEAGTKIYPPAGAARARIEIALYNAPTLLRQDCGDVFGCPPIVVPQQQPGRSGGASILRAVQQLFLEGAHRYDVTIARDSGRGATLELQSAVLAQRDDRWSARPSLSPETSRDGVRTCPVRSIGDDGRIGPTTSQPVLTVRRSRGSEEITVAGALPPGLYDVWDLDADDERPTGAPATLGTWILVATTDEAPILQRRFADASASIQWTGRASDTRVSVLRAYLVHLRTRPDD